MQLTTNVMLRKESKFTCTPYRTITSDVDLKKTDCFVRTLVP